MLSLGRASVEYICLTWADVIFCAACVLQILSYFGLVTFQCIIRLFQLYTMVNKTVLTQLSELLEKRDLKEIAAGTIVEAAEVTDPGNVYLVHVDT